MHALRVDKPLVECISFSIASSEDIFDDLHIMEQSEILEPFQVNMNGERVTVQVHKKDKLIYVARELKKMGHDIDVVYPTIRVNGVWTSEQETINTQTDYHFCK